MSALALALVLAAACCHASWNYFVKRVGGGPELVWLFSALASLIYLPVAILVFAVEDPVIGGREMGFIVGSALLHLAYFLLLQQGYRRGDLSLVYPIARATGPLLSSMFAVTILGEAVSPQIVAGALTIVVGVFFLTGGVRRGSAKAPHSLFFGLSAGILIGAYTVWDARTVTLLAVPPLLLDYASSVLRTLLLWPYAVSRRPQVREQWRRHRWRILAIAVFNPLAYILVLVALTMAPVVLVAPVRELSVLISVLLGAFLLREGMVWTRLIWAGVILTGVVLLAAV